jgi:hypothetical protein
MDNEESNVFRRGKQEAIEANAAIFLAAILKSGKYGLSSLSCRSEVVNMAWDLAQKFQDKSDKEI